MMAELIHSAQSFLNAEDAITVKWKKKDKRVEAEYMHHPGLKKAKTKEKKTKRVGK